MSGNKTLKKWIFSIKIFACKGNAVNNAIRPEMSIIIWPNEAVQLSTEVYHPLNKS